MFSQVSLLITDQYLYYPYFEITYLDNIMLLVESFSVSAQKLNDIFFITNNNSPLNRFIIDKCVICSTKASNLERLLLLNV